MMHANIKEQLKKKLYEEEQHLANELASIVGNKIATSGQPPFPQFGSKDDENAAEVATFSDALSLQRKIEESLHDVQSALRRIDDDAYGICRYCKKPIDERRLLARPESSSCVACKEELKSRT